MSMSQGPEKKPPVQSFQMPIDGVGVITGRGTFVTGKIRQGAVKIGDPVRIAGPGGKPTSSVVTALEKSGKAVGAAQAGDTVGVLLRGVNSEHVARGQVLQAG
jgi:elongation factor Tu